MSPTLNAQELRVEKGMATRIPKLFLLLGLFLSGTVAAGGNRAGPVHDEDREKETDTESPCEVKTVTVSTLPVLRENEFSFTGGGSGNVAGGESRLLLFVRTDLPGRISVLDDLDNTALPYFTLGKMSLPRAHGFLSTDPPHARDNNVSFYQTVKRTAEIAGAFRQCDFDICCCH